MSDLVRYDKSYSSLTIKAPPQPEINPLLTQDADRIISMLRALYRDILCSCENCERHRMMLVDIVNTAERIKSYGK